MSKDKTPKTAKTIKVKTVVISVAVVFAIVVSFIAGLYVKDAYNAGIDSKVNATVKQLKAGK